MTQELVHLIVKTCKEDSVFIYFALEACDGLAFYSTLPHQIGDEHRRIDIKATRGLEPELRQLLKSIEQRIPNFEIELDELVMDDLKLEDTFARDHHE
jgi:hypothetical protein